MKKSKMYIVKYSSGSWDDYGETNIFISSTKDKATKYVSKFNRILKKYKKYYSKFEEYEDGMIWIKDKYIKKYFTRWYKIRNINKCWYEEIEVR